MASSGSHFLQLMSLNNLLSQYRADHRNKQGIMEIMKCDLIIEVGLDFSWTTCSGRSHLPCSENSQATLGRGPHG